MLQEEGAASKGPETAEVWLEEEAGGQCGCSGVRKQVSVGRGRQKGGWRTPQKELWVSSVDSVQILRRMLYTPSS